MTDTTGLLPEMKLLALQGLPGAPELLEAVKDRPGVYLVGGAVRDLMLGFAQFDFDLVYEGQAADLAGVLAARLGGEVTVHERFGTATFRGGPDLVVDIAAARTETYSAPGALPEVTPSNLAEDLGRRDFTVNAMAVALWADRFGELIEYDGAKSDLLARVLRVTHDRSFIDDPTRLLRLLRYGARLGFTAEPHTEELARQAVDAGAMSTVSGPRIADELMDLLAERSALVALESMNALGLDRALDERFEADEYVASRALLNLPEGVSQDLLLMAVCCRAMTPEQLADWLDRMGLESHQRAIVADAALRHGEVFDGLSADDEASTIDAALRRFKPETVVLAYAVPGADRELAERARAWLDVRNHDYLMISGADLRRAGVPEGPAIGRALAATMALAIDGEATGRDEQLRRAIEFARADAHPE